MRRRRESRIERKEHEAEMEEPNSPVAELDY